MRSGDEKAKVADLARQAAGTEKVNDQMSIEKSRVTRKKERMSASRELQERSAGEIIHCCDLCCQSFSVRFWRAPTELCVKLGVLSCQRFRTRIPRLAHREMLRSLRD